MLTKFLSGWRTTINRPVAYAGVSKEGGGTGNSENLRIMKTRMNQKSFFGSKLGENQKKGLHSNSVRFLAQNWVKAKRKDLRQPLVCSNLLPKSQRGWGVLQFAYYSMLILLSFLHKYAPETDLYFSIGDTGNMSRIESQKPIPLKSSYNGHLMAVIREILKWFEISYSVVYFYGFIKRHFASCFHPHKKEKCNFAKLINHDE